MFSNDRVNIIAVGISEYEFINKLYGPAKDIEKLKKLLCIGPAALFSEDKFNQQIDIDTNTLRNVLINYATNRTADNDILVFYFSGHATPVGNSDLGLCLKDYKTHFNHDAVIPLSVVRFSDIIQPCL